MKEFNSTFLNFFSVFCFITSLCLSTSSSSFAQISYRGNKLVQVKAKAINADKKINNVLEKEFKKFTIIQLDAKSIYNYVAKQPGQVDFQLIIGDVESWNLSFQSNELRSIDYQTNNKKASYYQSYKLQESRPTTYKGYVNGDENYRLRISLYEYLFTAMFNDNGKRTYIEPLSSFSSDAPKDYFVLYSDKNVKTTTKFECGNTSKNAYYQLKKLRKNIGSPRHGHHFTSGCMEIAVEADFEYCDKKGRDTDAYIDNIINLASDEYEEIFNLKLKKIQQNLYHHSVGLDIRNEGDDPYDSKYASTMLSEIQRQLSRISHPTQTQTRDVGVLFTGKSILNAEDEGIAGLARTGKTCTDPVQSVAVVEEKSTKSKSWILLAHELGHGLGHDGHASSGIMATSLAIATSSFSDDSKDKIKEHLNNHGKSCLKCGNNGCNTGAKLLNPIEQETLREVILFSNQELNQNILDLKKIYIQYERELLPIFSEKENKKSRNAQQILNSLKKDFAIKLAHSFVENKAVTFDDKDISNLNKLLQEVSSLVNTKALKTYTKKLISALPILKGKEIKKGLIAFDKINLDAESKSLASLKKIEFSLIQTLQSYPILNYDAPRNGQLKLQLFDLNGRHIRTISTNEQVNNGHHTKEISTNDLASATYILHAVFEDEFGSSQYTAKIIAINH